MTLSSKILAAKELVGRYAEKYAGKICVGCSFGKDSMVLLHLVREVAPDLPVLCWLADTEFDETYEFCQRIADEWGLDYYETRFEQRPEVFRGDVSQCCGDPKVEAAVNSLEPYEAWFSGVRNTEGITRHSFPSVSDSGGLVKINPILEFTETDIWRYTALYEVPVNPIYKLGYRSLGCKICSTPEQGDESERHGRWRGCKKEECGIHTQSLRR